MQGLNYIRRWDYDISDTRLSEKNRPIGRWGQMCIRDRDDLLMITADHGNDPTYTGTDHTREKVPFLAYSPSMKGQGELPEAETFAVIGETILDNFGLKKEENMIGASVLRCVLETGSWRRLPFQCP